MPTHNASAEALNQLRTDTERAVSTLESRASAGLDIDAHFADIQKKFEDAAQMKDEQERNIRMKILSANLEEIRQDAAKEEQDLASAVFGLNAMLESLGAEYLTLTQFNSSEQKLVDDAERRLKNAEVARAQAEQKWFFKDAAIQQSDAEIKAAKTALDEAKAEARRRARQRLLTADMEASLQEFMLRVEKTIQIMQRRMAEIDKQLDIVAARKTRAFEIKEAAARQLEELDRDLSAKEAELKKQEELLQATTAGTDEHVALQHKVSDLRAAVEKIRGERNTAFVLHQSKDKFAAELEIHEKTQLKLRDNQRMWITSLRSDTEERVVTFRSRLEAMKAAADQNIAKSLDDLGAEADRRNAEYMATVGAASDRLRMDKIEKHPARIAQIAEIAAAQAEAVQQIRLREAKAIEEFKRLYGIDPTASSFFHYQDDTADDSTGGGSSSGVF